MRVQIHMDEPFVLILIFEKCYLFYCAVNNYVTRVGAAGDKVSVILPALCSHISVSGKDVF